MCTPMDMEMDMADGGFGGTDYGEFKYDQFIHEVTGKNQSGGALNLDSAANAEPLQGQGGLDNNEVAELVYAELFVHVEHDDETGDQDAASDSEFRGTFGANLQESGQSLLGGTDPGWNGTELNENDGSFIRTPAGRYQTEDNVFQVFQANGALPSDDSTNGPGSNGGSNVVQYEKNWRELTGRGPVLDANDDLVVVSRLIANDATIAVSGVLHGHLVWDVAEISDAGREFSVPR